MFRAAVRIGRTCQRSAVDITRKNKDVSNNVSIPCFQSIRNFSDSESKVLKTKDGAIIVLRTAFTLEWVLSSPPPLHQFEESPIFVEWPVDDEETH